jgi:hypothetical protein
MAGCIDHQSLPMWRGFCCNGGCFGPKRAQKDITYDPVVASNAPTSGKNQSTKIKPRWRFFKKNDAYVVVPIAI